jgi:hypothetical protein
MRDTTLILLLGLTIISCTPKSDTKNEIADQESTSTSDTLTIGERTNGLTTVYDSINGKPIFTLYDNILVDCSEPFKGWYGILLYMEIDTAEYKTMDKLEKGRKLISDGRTIGEVLTEMPAYGATDYKSAWLRLEGAIRQENIKSETIIESAIQQYNTQIRSRNIRDYRQFINDFQLDSTQQFGLYMFFYNYESSLDDPSPLYRLGLLFKNDSLKAIVHSRPFEMEGTTDRKLHRGFNCLVYPDMVDSAKFRETFNTFIHQVD